MLGIKRSLRLFMFDLDWRMGLLYGIGDSDAKRYSFIQYYPILYSYVATYTTFFFFFFFFFFLPFKRYLFMCE